MEQSLHVTSSTENCFLIYFYYTNECKHAHDKRNQLNGCGKTIRKKYTQNLFSCFHI